MGPTFSCKLSCRTSPGDPEGVSGVDFGRKLLETRGRKSLRPDLPFRVPREARFSVLSFMAEGRSDDEAADAALKAAIARHAQLVESGVLAPAAARQRFASGTQHTSPVAGVCWNAKGKTWKVRLTVRSQCLQKDFKPVGSTEEAIRQARLEAEAYRRGLELEHFGQVQPEVVTVQAAPRKLEELFTFKREEHETGISWYGHENRFQVQIKAGRQPLQAYVRLQFRTQENFDAARGRAVRVRDALRAVRQRILTDPSADVAALVKEASMTP